MRTRPPNGVFVFVDHDSLWHSFHQVAALVRRNGMQAVRVTTAHTGPLERLANRLLYARCHYLSGTAGLETLPSLLEPFTVMQVYLTEPMMAHLPDHIYRDLPPAVAADIRRRVRLSDKTMAARMAAELGIRAPEQLAANIVQPTIAVQTFGLPLVVKAKLGAAGSGVTIAATVADIEQAVQAPEGRDGLFFERHISGQIVSYAATVFRGTIVQELTYQAVKSSSNPTGAPLAFEVIADDNLLNIGRTLCRALDLNGPINVQTVRDATGDCWMIDLNLRPYGPMLSYQQHEIDTAAAFLYSTGVCSTPPQRRSASLGVRAYTFPNDAEELMRHGQPGRALYRYALRAPSFRRMLGINYLLYTSLSALAHKIDARMARIRN
ncbi:hypothetical protein [Mycolicibacterium llatzerense]|uniref:hypothetical protein n=1 Tax=Mycolicibacterium llatzerense TaxID=280871 RepID=UPI0013A6D4A0|nr:hypothetical protein [Mycolicibacterium llatzerense]